MTTLPLSGTDYIDALVRGDSWTGTVGKAATITYSTSLPENAWVHDNDILAASNESLFALPQPLSATNTTAIEIALQQFAKVANLSYTKTTDATLSSQLAFRDLNLLDYYEFGTLSGAVRENNGTTQIAYAGVVYDSEIVDAPNSFQGNRDYYIILHEIGHALGLKHISEGEDALPFASTLDYTIMTISGYDSGNYATQLNLVGPQIYDIAALQYIYGANTDYNAGDTTYLLTPEVDNSNVAFDKLTIIELGQTDQAHGNVAYTIWDGGGIDTIDASAYDTDVTLDLRAGVGNINTVGKNYLWTAFNSNIENATAGSGNDIIHGNNLANTLISGAGDDTISGLEGNDTYKFAVSGDGADTIIDSDGLGKITIGADDLTGTAVIIIHWMVWT